MQIIGPVYDASGYAAATRALAVELMKRGVKVQLTPLAWGQTAVPLDEEERRYLEKARHNRTTGGPQIFFSIAPNFRKEPGRPAIGYTMLESDGLPPHWVGKCLTMDEIWVPSNFNRETFARSGVNLEKIRVMPLGIDTSLFSPEAPPFKPPGIQGFIFFSNFEWILRKGYDLLLTAFAEEFPDSQDVYLLLRTYSNGPDFDLSGQKISQRIRTFLGEREKVLPRILLLPGIYDSRHLASFYTGSHCFLLPTRGEGWNLPALEALSCGRPVITTAWSGHLQYLTSENSYLIPVEGLEPVPRLGIPNDETYVGTNWARPSLPATRRLMRRVVENWSEARGKGERGRQDVLAHFSLERWIDAVIQRLDEVPRDGHLGGPTPLVHQPATGSPPAAEPGPEQAKALAMVVPSWGRPCGVAEYSRSLVEALRAEGSLVEIFNEALTGLVPWMRQRGLKTAHFQYEYSLYDNEALLEALNQLRQSGMLKIITLHSFAPAAAFVNQSILGRFDQVIVHSSQMVRELLSQGVEASRLAVIPMGVPSYPLGVREESRSQLGLVARNAGVTVRTVSTDGPARYYGKAMDKGRVFRVSERNLSPGPSPQPLLSEGIGLGFFGFVFPQKGIPELALATRELRRFYPHLQTFLFCSLAPGGISQKHFEQVVDFLKTNDLWSGLNLRLEYAPLERIVPLLHAMDINILPYLDNGGYGTSAAVRTLMAAQRPIIVTDSPFFSDLQGEVLKIPSARPQEIVLAVRRVLSDPQLAANLVKASMVYQREHSWRRMARLHQCTYLGDR
ncbi:MAG: glycosyltransferase [Firmicutes bacterium]|nr:glycosyltransferase [Bacillota bacterium]